MFNTLCVAIFFCVLLYLYLSIYNSLFFICLQTKPTRGQSMERGKRKPQRNTGSQANPSERARHPHKRSKHPKVTLHQHGAKSKAREHQSTGHKHKEFKSQSQLKTYNPTCLKFTFESSIIYPLGHWRSIYCQVANKGRDLQSSCIRFHCASSEWCFPRPQLIPLLNKIFWLLKN